ncbi:N-acetylglucosaminyl deacetylase, LmbE family [Amycolatopsis xylanica]|uniref:N-acetylglucosaminyl deacetylase, LmbE family n=1 Tax=Amycolatopsis xylanica TaxID=589385 RepID=A0A1H3SD89_9PSEU|nr:PIG-L family deacetylase [Amycolatopsis xylanica]SDZ35630.1 N-acetylglucosaminyl deacetylase, LmbE family [Amycolatopsis xylanica]
MTFSATIFSAHLDDAVLSAAAQLSRPRARVVTVFAGPPPASIDRTRWDKITRASSSAERYAERLAEDERAVAALGCASVRLPEPEDQYRDGELDQRELIAKLRPYLAESAEIWLPAGIGDHPDHALLRDAVLAALREGPAAPAVFVYADLPYALRFGWPSRATGVDNPPYLDVDFWINEELVACGFDRSQLTERVFELTEDLKRAKERAVLCYRSQLPALVLTPDDTRRWQSFFRYELAWELAVSGQ